MSLGVGGATPYAMNSNHPTAYNHSFRDSAGFDPAKQTKVKCKFCGCWATRGKACYQCKRDASGRLASSSRLHASSFNISRSEQHERRRTVKADAEGATELVVDRSGEEGGGVERRRQEKLNNELFWKNSRSGGNNKSSSSSHHHDATNGWGNNTTFTHSFRDVSSYDAPSCNVKVKCSYCGCWARTGVPCSLCRTVNRKKK